MTDDFDLWEQEVSCGIEENGFVCQRPAGHDAMHESRMNGQTVAWCGDDDEDVCGVEYFGYTCDLPFGHTSPLHHCLATEHSVQWRSEKSS